MAVVRNRELESAIRALLDAEEFSLSPYAEVIARLQQILQATIDQEGHPPKGSQPAD